MNKLFPWLVLLSSFMAFYHHEYAGFGALFCLFLLTIPAWVMALVISGSISGAEEFPRSPHIFWVAAVCPFIDVLFELNGNQINSVWHWLYYFVFFAILFANVIRKKIKHIQSITVLLLVSATIQLYFADWGHRTHQGNPIHSISGSIPKTVLEEKRAKGGADYYLVINNQKFECSPNLVEKSAKDKLLCQDIYSHDGKMAHIDYIFDKKAEKSILSVRVGQHHLWTNEQAHEFYRQKYELFWREFYGGILLITLPFVLFYFWAQKIMFRQPENPYNQHENTPI